MAGKIIADQIEHSTAGSLDTQYVVNGSAKHWINMDAGQTINGSINTSSIVDNTTADHAVNLANALSDIHYAVTGSNIGSVSGSDSGESLVSSGDIHTTTKYEFRTRHNSGTYYDNGVNQLHLSGDLA
jgi:hypothetical protein